VRAHPPELLVIRHAESEWNALGRWQGHSDPPLSARGLEQARALAQQLAHERIDRIEASDLARARATAAPLAAQLGAAVRLDAIYRELDLGEWAGLTRAQIEARDAGRLAPFDRGVASARAPGGESRADVARRARAALESLCLRFPNERVAVVTHGGFLRALFPASERRDFANASVHRASAAELLEALSRAADREGGPGPDSY